MRTIPTPAKMIKKITTKIKPQERGISLVFVTLLIPVIMVIGTLIIDGGRYYITYSQLNFLSREILSSAFITLNNKFIQSADQNYNYICSQLVKPEICSEKKIQNFLSISQRKNIVEDSQTLMDINAEINHFLSSELQSLSLNSENIITEIDYQDLQNSVLVRTQITYEPLRYFSYFLNSHHDSPQQISIQKTKTLQF